MKLSRRTILTFASAALLSALAFGAWHLFGSPKGIQTYHSYSSKEEQVSFGDAIQPILSANCYHCHGSDAGSRQGGLRLDTEEDAKRLREGHAPAIVAGRPDESEIIRRILSDDPRKIMPPSDNHKPLKPKEVALLKEWIRQGARYEPHWALIKPVRPAVPKNAQPWSDHPIDAFVLARLQKEGLTPEGEAAPRTLIRRVTLDLTGLPPTPAEVEAFVKDPSAAHYEKIVDDLLSRPTYGEARARLWLDAARYGDTHGLHVDNHRLIWPFRDWVINAYNANKPFDQFVTEQLAGDMLPDSTDQQKIATGFLRAQVTTGEGGVIVDEVAATMATEQVHTVSTVFTGLTMQCAACHDHKFDAISQRDFYRMTAFFRNSTQKVLDSNRPDNPPFLLIPAEADKARWDKLKAEAPKIKWGNVANGNLKGKDKQLADEIIGIWERGTPSLIMEEKQNSIPKAHVLIRGEYSQRGEEVTAGVPEVFPQIPKDQPQNRLGLANWLVSADNPLMARVTVNRFWQEFFGTGIVKTSEDFGIMGERPINRPLLDWLAVEFMENGWDTKKIIRLLVTSAAYKQSPVIQPEKLEKDLENRLVSRGPRFRMDAEVLRDQALAVSGLLNPKIGGPSVKPYQPEGMWEAVAMNESTTSRYVQDTGDKLYRRSMYTFLKRSSPHPNMETLGMPSREVCTVRRDRTNTPLQALVMLNDPQYVEASRKLALDAINASDDPSRRLDYFSERLLARPLTPAEKEQLLVTKKKISARYESQPKDAEQLLTVGQFPPDQTIPAPEQATWAMMASIFLNLDESLNR